MSTAEMKSKILWYLERIVDYLSDAQARTILTMLKKFYAQIGRRE